MSSSAQICYLNDRWMPLSDATVSVLDRGFIFGDGVYEVLPVDTVDIGGQRVRAPFRPAEHYARLARSLAAVGITNPHDDAQWMALTAQLIERHPWARQLIYVQVTRGVAKRDHAFPQGVIPTIFAMSSEWPEIPSEAITRGVVAVTHPDERWLHCDIKSTSLLGNVLMKQYAVEHGATETVMLRDGHLTEGSSTNVFVVKDGIIAAPAKSHQMLPGITYDATLAIAQSHGARVELRPIAQAELHSADELWLSSSGREVMPVTTLDGAPVGSGTPGPMYARMREWFVMAKREDARRWSQRFPLPTEPASGGISAHAA